MKSCSVRNQHVMRESYLYPFTGHCRGAWPALNVIRIHNIWAPLLSFNGKRGAQIYHLYSSIFLFCCVSFLLGGLLRQSPVKGQLCKPCVWCVCMGCFFAFQFHCNFPDISLEHCCHKQVTNELPASSTSAILSVGTKNMQTGRQGYKCSFISSFIILVHTHVHTHLHMSS